MSLDYISEKLNAAVFALATNSESIQKRLEYAANACHTISGPPHSEEGFPTDALKTRFIQWFKDITAKEAASRDEGSIAATTRSLTDEGARVLATELLNIYVKVEAYYVQKYPPE